MDNNGYEEDDATHCVGCKFYVELPDDYAECDVGKHTYGEWTNGKCDLRETENE